MIVVDSSVWIANLRGRPNLAVSKLHGIDDTEHVIVGDLVLLDVLQGARNETHAAQIERSLRQFIVAPMLNERLAVQASRNYRTLRERGITVRKTIDIIIGTFCIEQGHFLLHDDRDFDPMATHLGLNVM